MVAAYPKTENAPYPNKFKTGDVAIAKYDIVADNGTIHKQWDRILVVDGNKRYFNVNYQHYANKNNLKHHIDIPN